MLSQEQIYNEPKSSVRNSSTTNEMQNEEQSECQNKFNNDVVKQAFYDEKILSAIQKYVDPTVREISQIECREVSGMSNRVFIIGIDKEKHTPSEDAQNQGNLKLVMRFLESQSSDSIIEAKFVDLLSRLGHTSRVYEQTNALRIDQFIEGRTFTWDEIMQPQYAKKIAKSLAYLNYEPAAKTLASELTGQDCSYTQLCNQSEDGWLHTFQNKVRPRLQQLDTSNHPEVKEIIEYFEQVFQNWNELIKEVQSVIPEVSEERKQIDLVFSHNDMQEGNMIYNSSTGNLVLIDFEYSSINNRGNDLASLINEACIEYDTKEQVQYTYHPDSQVTFEADEQGNNIAEQFCKSYLEEAHKATNRTDDINDWINDEMPTLLQQVKCCVVLQHFWWAIWSLIMAPLNNLEEAARFTFPFAKFRMQLYFQDLERLLGKKSNFASGN